MKVSNSLWKIFLIFIFSIFIKEFSTTLCAEDRTLVKSTDSLAEIYLYRIAEKPKEKSKVTGVMLMIAGITGVIVANNPDAVNDNSVRILSIGLGTLLVNIGIYQLTTPGRAEYEYLSYVHTIVKEYNLFCKKGEYLKAGKKISELLEIEPTNPEWKKTDEKLKKIVEIVSSETGKERISVLIRKSVNSYLGIEGDERIAVLSVRYALQMKPNNQIAIKLCSFIEHQYPGIAKVEVTPHGKTVVEHKLSLALDYIYDGKYEKAILECDDVLVLEEYNVLALKRKGSAYYALGEKDKAKIAWEKAAQISPAEPEIKKFLQKIKQ
ncbi:MAG: tetratricopeptide repeat protein [Elusimicrobiota bacterium]